MDFNLGSKKVFIVTVLLSMIFLTFSYYNSQVEGSKVVFCDIGQGDAAYIRIENKLDILIDAGANREVLNCLGRHMPFYDRKIELAFISHPQIDHYGGFKEVISRYEVDNFVIAPVLNPNKSYPALIASINAKGIPLRQLYDGDSIDLTSHAQVKYLWPTKKFVEINTYPRLDNNEKSVLGTTSEDLNSFSEIFVLSIGEFDVIFTGDALPEILNQVVNDSDITGSSIEVLKVPHHGSKNGLTRTFLDAVKPQALVISVGKNNRYGHPHQSIIEMLKSYGKPYYLTSAEGDIVIRVTDSDWFLEKDM